MTTVQERRETQPARRPAERRYAPPVDRRSHHPAELIVRRPELYGVYGVADIACDAVLWSA